MTSITNSLNALKAKLQNLETEVTVSSKKEEIEKEKISKYNERKLQEKMKRILDIQNLEDIILVENRGIQYEISLNLIRNSIFANKLQEELGLIDSIPASFETVISEIDTENTERKRVLLDYDTKNFDLLHQLLIFFNRTNLNLKINENKKDTFILNVKSTESKRLLEIEIKDFFKLTKTNFLSNILAGVGEEKEEIIEDYINIIVD